MTSRSLDGKSDRAAADARQPRKRSPKRNDQIEPKFDAALDDRPITAAEVLGWFHEKPPVDACERMAAAMNQAKAWRHMLPTKNDAEFTQLRSAVLETQQQLKSLLNKHPVLEFDRSLGKLADALAQFIGSPWEDDPEAAAARRARLVRRGVPTRMWTVAMNDIRIGLGRAWVSPITTTSCIQTDMRVRNLGLPPIEANAMRAALLRVHGYSMTTHQIRTALAAERKAESGTIARIKADAEKLRQQAVDELTNWESMPKII